MLDGYTERMQAAGVIARKIIDLCQSFEATPTQTTINRFLMSVERLADLAESIEVEQTAKALDG